MITWWMKRELTPEFTTASCKWLNLGILTEKKAKWRSELLQPSRILVYVDGSVRSSFCLLHWQIGAQLAGWLMPGQQDFHPQDRESLQIHQALNIARALKRSVLCRYKMHATFHAASSQPHHLQNDTRPLDAHDFAFTKAFHNFDRHLQPI